MSSTPRDLGGADFTEVGRGSCSTTVGRLVQMTTERFRQPQPRTVPPAVYRALYPSATTIGATSARRSFRSLAIRTRRWSASPSAVNEPTDTV